MNPWLHLLSPMQAPKWSGQARVHRLEDEPIAPRVRRWIPWSLLTPSSRLLSEREVVQCWPLLGGA